MQSQPLHVTTGDAALSLDLLALDPHCPRWIGKRLAATARELRSAIRTDSGPQPETESQDDGPDISDEALSRLVRQIFGDPEESGLAHIGAVS